MSAIAVSPDSTVLNVGDSWLLAVEIRDDVTDLLTDATTTAVVTRPDTTTSVLTVTKQSLGFFTAPYTLAAPGRHTALVTTSGAVVSVTDFQVTALGVNTVPTASEVQVYLDSVGTNSYTLAEVTAALAAETAAQERVCRMPATYPADLKEALFRRVAKNLAARQVPLTVYTSFENGATTKRVPMRDPEVARLEAPFRRFPMG